MFCLQLVEDRVPIFDRPVSGRETLSQLVFVLALHFVQHLDGSPPGHGQPVQTDPTVIECDNKQALGWSTEQMVTNGNRFIERDYHKVKEWVEMGHLDPRHVKGTDNPSDGVRGAGAAWRGKAAKDGAGVAAGNDCRGSRRCGLLGGVSRSGHAAGG